MKLMSTSALLLGLWSMTMVESSSSSSSSSFLRKSVRDYRVHGLEDIEPAFAQFDGHMYAGLMSTIDVTSKHHSAEDEEGALMFWLFVPSEPVYDDTLVIWLNGGPGCSSMSGCLFENCPATIPRKPAGYFPIDAQAPLEPNPYAWTHATPIMYVEQPHGTGFSQGPYPNNETDVGRDFYNFLQNLFDLFDNDPEAETQLRNKRLHFFGESYAGMYVPSIAHYIHEQNKQNLRPRIHLSGIALGNGWIDARVQGPAVIDYAYWHGMIDSATFRAMHAEWENCKDGSPQNPPFHDFTVPDECGIMAQVLLAAGKDAVEWGGPNAYDVTTWDPYLMLDAPDGGIMTFYNNPRVQDALHAPRKEWSGCIPGAGRRRALYGKLPGQSLLAHDQPESVVPYIADLLDDAKIKVLIYAGDRDMTTNSQGSEYLLDHMDWSGAAGWSDTNQFDRGLWLTGEKTLGGYIKTFRNLQLLIVSNSGHLVPFNRDAAALDLVTRFLGGKTFMDKALPKFNIQAKNKQSVENVLDGTVGANANEKTQWKMGRIGAAAATAGVGGAILVAFCSFVSGFLLSRRFSSKRSDYEMVPSGHIS